jgi:hypothetical protein
VVPLLNSTVPRSARTDGGAVVGLIGANFSSTGEAVAAFAGFQGYVVVNATFVSTTLLRAISPAWPDADAGNVSIALNGQQFGPAIPFLFYGMRLSIIRLLAGGGFILSDVNVVQCP